MPDCIEKPAIAATNHFWEEYRFNNAMRFMS